MLQDEDSEYLYMIHQKDDESLKMLISKYRRILNKVLYESTFYAKWMNDYSEVRQIALVILYDAILAFRDDQLSSFQHYYLHILKNQLIDETRKRNRYYDVVSLDTPIYEDTGVYLKDCIVNTEPRYEADWLIRRQMMELKLEKWYAPMDYVEKQVLRLRYYGFSYQEIAAYLHINEKKVDNTIHKIRKRKGMIDYNSTL